MEALTTILFCLVPPFYFTVTSSGSLVNSSLFSKLGHLPALFRYFRDNQEISCKMNNKRVSCVAFSLTGYLPETSKT